MGVIDNNFETQGTHLFFIDVNATPSRLVRKLTCPTGITGVNGGTADRIDTTCLDVNGRFRKNITGMADPGDITVPFILYDGDASHKALFTLHQSGQVVGWYMGLSDSTATPTMDTDMSDLVSPAARTGFSFRGSVANLTIDAATNEVVRGTLTVRPTGGTTAYWAP